jgi:xylan 1,4-beta-xylosidase
LRTAWVEAGRPQDPTPDQLANIRLRGELQECSAPAVKQHSAGEMILTFGLPLHGVSLIEFAPA